MDRTQTKDTSRTEREDKPRRRPHVHWHPFFTHFPISMFGTAFLFQVLHFFYAPECFELATVATFSLGTLAMIPTTWTGWTTWKKKFKGRPARIFTGKIYLAFGMLAFSIGVSVWRVVLHWPLDTVILTHTEHVAYFILVTLLIAGAGAEGYYGGRLRPR